MRASLLGATVAATVVATGLAGSLLHMREDLATRAGDLSAAVGRLPDMPEKVRQPDLAAFVAAAPMPIRVLGTSGAEIARTGDDASIWQRADAGTLPSLTLTGTSAHLLDGAVEVARPLAHGRVVVARTPVNRAAMTVPGTHLVALAILGALLGTIAALLSVAGWRRRSRDVAAVTAAAETLLSGRVPEAGAIHPDSELARAGEAIRSGAQRLGQLSEVADRELGLLTAAIEPLPIGVLGRGPAGGRLRNLALERLVEGLSSPDRAALETALREGLESTDAVGGRVRMSDGRLFEVDAWTVPGGRLVSVSERSEQERLAAFRQQIEGAAVRQLRAPIDEIKSRGTELYQHIPAPAAPTLRAILGATDRLDRVVRMMLRGTSHDPALRPPRRETFGVAGFLWGLAHDWDAALRQRALRVELDIAGDLPDVKTDPALVQEILTELIDNAAKFTPRGGTIQLGAASRGVELVIDVHDNGAGVAPQDAPLAVERFFRGQSSESIPGAGLGLGVAAALAERLGGRLEVLAGPGGHVRLYLPVEAAALAAA